MRNEDPSRPPGNSPKIPQSPVSNSSIKTRTKGPLGRWALALLIVVTALAVATVSLWLVLPYLLLMGWMLFAPSREPGTTSAELEPLDHAPVPSAAANQGFSKASPPVDPLTRSPEEVSSDSSDSSTETDSEPEPEPEPQTASVTTTELEPIKPRRKRRRNKDKASAHDQAEVKWVRVGPGKFVRQEVPTTPDNPSPPENEAQKSDAKPLALPFSTDEAQNELPPTSEPETSEPGSQDPPPPPTKPKTEPTLDDSLASESQTIEELESPLPVPVPVPVQEEAAEESAEADNVPGESGVLQDAPGPDFENVQAELESKDVDPWQESSNATPETEIEIKTDWSDLATIGIYPESSPTENSTTLNDQIPANEPSPNLDNKSQNGTDSNREPESAEPENEQQRSEASIGFDSWAFAEDLEELAHDSEQASTPTGLAVSIGPLKPPSMLGPIQVERLGGEDAIDDSVSPDAWASQDALESYLESFIHRNRSASDLGVQEPEVEPGELASADSTAKEETLESVEFSPTTELPADEPEAPEVERTSQEAANRPEVATFAELPEPENENKTEHEPTTQTQFEPEPEPVLPAADDEEVSSDAGADSEFPRPCPLADWWKGIQRSTNRSRGGRGRSRRGGGVCRRGSQQGRPRRGSRSAWPLRGTTRPHLPRAPPPFKARAGLR